MNGSLFRGLHAITPKLHAGVLQDLLTKMYGEHATNSREGAKETLIRYIFCFGVRKIRGRLNTKIHETMLPYIHLLTSSEISSENFITKRTNVKPKLPQRLENADERWLKEALEAHYPDTNVHFVEKGKKSIHLCLNRDQEWNLWTLFKEYLEGLQVLTDYLENFIDGKKQLKSPEDNIHQHLPFEIYMILTTLHLLTNDSPTFWTMMEQRKELMSSVQVSKLANLALSF